MKKLAIEHIDNLMRANGLDSVSAKDFRAQRKQVMTSPEQDRYEADLEFARDVESEVLRINGLTAESAEQREKGQAVAYMREGWGPDCGPYIEFYRADEMGWRDTKDWTPLYTTPPTLPAGAPDGWQPIETAPKEESVLLADGSYVGEGFWHDGSECYGHRGKAGWFWESDRGNLLTASNAHASHWMPLPAAPQPEDTPAIFKEQAS